MASDSPDSALKLCTGGGFHPNMGVEFGYIDAGKAHRLGGDTKAHGFISSSDGNADVELTAVGLPYRF